MSRSILLSIALTLTALASIELRDFQRRYPDDMLAIAAYGVALGTLTAFASAGMYAVALMLLN